MASVKIIDGLKRVKSINTALYPIFNIKKSKQQTLIKETLPFRIKFINVGIPGYSSNSPAPIGIAIVGLNNYIL